MPALFAMTALGGPRAAKLEELSAKRETAQTRMNELAAILSGSGEGDDAIAAREFTDEEQAEWDRLDVEEKELAEQIAAEEKALTAHADAANAARERINAFQSGVTVPQIAAAGTRQQTENRQPLYAVPKHHHNLRYFTGSAEGRDSTERAFRFGHYMRAVATACMPNRYSFYDSVQFCHDYMGVQMPGMVGMFAGGFQNAAHGSGGADTTGGHFLVPEEFDSDMIDLRLRYGVIRRLFRRRPMMSDTKNIPRRTGGLTPYFRNQGSAGTESSKTWDNVQLIAKDLMVIARYNRELGEDAVIDLGDDLAGELIYAFTTKEDDCGINGDGTSTYDGIVGVRTKLQSFDGAGTDSTGLKTGSGNAWSELVLSDFDSVVGVLPDYADNPNTAWLMHRTFFYEVIEPLVQAQGGVTAQETREGNRRPRPLFKGYPVEFSNQFPSSEANSSVVCTLGDYSLGAAFGDRQQDEISFSEHAYVNSESLWERNQIGIRGTERFDIKVHDVGDASNAGPICGLQTAAS